MTDPARFHAFADELEKISAVGSLGRKLLGSATRGALTGGLAGAAAGALTSDPEASAVERVERAIKSGVKGGIVGGIGGSVARRALDYRLLHPGSTGREVAAGTARSLGGAVKRFAKRQAHGLTGAYGSDLGGMGMDSAAQAKKDIHLAGLRKSELLRDARSAGESGVIRARHQEEVAKHLSRGVQGEETARRGLTSLPGIVKGLATRPKETARAMWRQSTGGGGRLASAAAVTVPLAFAAPDLMRGDESDEGGPTMKHKLLRAGAGLAGGIATAGLPFVPQQIVTEAINKATTHRQRVPGRTVVRDSHSLERQQERDDVR